MLTNEQLAEIEARAAESFPGPWAHGPESHGVYAPGHQSPRMKPIVEEALSPSEAIFIAHAREDIPALIAHIRELEAERLTAEERETVLGALAGEIAEEAKLALQFGAETASRKKHDARVDAAAAARAKIEAMGGEG